jgi:hypothetical protein
MTKLDENGNPIVDENEEVTPEEVVDTTEADDLRAELEAEKAKREKRESRFK